jgi:hypothetical protein
MYTGVVTNVLVWSRFESALKLSERSDRRFGSAMEACYTSYRVRTRRDQKPRCYTSCQSLVGRQKGLEQDRFEFCALLLCQAQYYDPETPMARLD